MKKTFLNIAMMATAVLAMSACSSTKKISENNSNDITHLTADEELDPEYKEHHH